MMNAFYLSRLKLIITYLTALDEHLNHCFSTNMLSLTGQLAKFNVIQMATTVPQELIYQKTINTIMRRYKINDNRRM
jgi:sRNA-binding regulator protein Hfq